jgi:hypothetical protein
VTRKTVRMVKGILIDSFACTVEPVDLIPHETTS